MSIIRNNKTYGIETKKMPANNQNKTITANGEYTADAGYDGLGTVTVNVQPQGVQYVTAHYLVSAPSNSFSIFYTTSGVSGYRVKGASTWETPTTAIAVTTTGELEIEFQLTDPTTIPESMFSQNNNLFRVELPTTVTTIRNSAFYNCKNNLVVDLENITKIYENPFYGAKTGYGKVVVNDNIQRDWGDISQITTSAYVYCNGVLYGFKSFEQKYRDLVMDFSNGIDGLPITKWRAYIDFGSIPEIKFPSTLTHIGQYTFYGITFGDMYFYGTTPPATIGNDGTPFEGGTTVTHIYVPAESVAAYQASPTFAKVASAITAMP